MKTVTFLTLLLICVCFWPYTLTSVSTSHTFLLPMEGRRGHWMPRNGVTGGCEPPCGCWERTRELCKNTKCSYIWAVSLPINYFLISSLRAFLLSNTVLSTKLVASNLWSWNSVTCFLEPQEFLSRGAASQVTIRAWAERHGVCVSSDFHLARWCVSAL